MDETEVQELEDEQDIEAIQELKSSFDPEILGFLQQVLPKKQQTNNLNQQDTKS